VSLPFYQCASWISEPGSGTGVNAHVSDGPSSLVQKPSLTHTAFAGANFWHFVSGFPKLVSELACVGDSELLIRFSAAASSRFLVRHTNHTEGAGLSWEFRRCCTWRGTQGG